jgi:tetratricopeptide (TPR) repeat protein
VARKPKHHAPHQLSAAELTNRIRRAENEGRFQQALELAKQLHKHDPSPANRDLLKNVTLGRARQLRAQNYTRDACSVLEHAAELDDSPAWLEQVAEELAACGDARRALGLLDRLPAGPARQKVLARAADTALAQGKAGRGLLPEGLHGQFDLIVQAFAQAEAGQDEQARTALQGIGLQSPFLEWKLLLRGLLAYYQKDDARAVENWQRLSPDRLPARLAAPLRFSIDAGFRVAQPPATQVQLRQQADKLQGPGLAPSLRAVQAAMSNERQLPQAFRQAEGLLPALRREAPLLVPRLAACFYWAVISHGQPEDMNRFKRVFGTPADDPQLARLEALALEHRQDLQGAHKCWQRFEKSVADHPAAWPGEQAQRVRALVWCHMGLNAASVPDPKELPDLPGFLRDPFASLRPLSPSAEKCFQRSLELAPDQLETHRALFEHYRRRDKDARAEETARRLLERFPEHVPTLEALADLRMRRQDYAEALGLFQRALKGNPLERRLRAKVATAHSYHARSLAEAGRFDEARPEYQAALALDDRGKSYPVLCKWAACEFKAGDTARAEELLARAHAEEGSRLAVAFSMLIETIRFKLPRALKTRFDKDFNEALAEPPAAQAAAAIADTAASHRLAGVTYVGQKTHEKKVFTYLEKAVKADFTEDQLSRVCLALLALDAKKQHRTYVKLGQKKFPQSPFFYLAEAEFNIKLGPQRCPVWQTRDLLEKARELANAMPREPKQQEMLETIQRHQDLLGVLNPFAASRDMLEDMMDEMFGVDDEDDEDEEDWF